MEVARATEMDIEVDAENNSTKVQSKNDTLGHNDVLAEEDVNLAMNSCLPNSSKVKNINYLKPNDKPDIDILLFLNPSLMIQCQIDFIWKKINTLKILVFFLKVIMVLRTKKNLFQPLDLKQ